MNLFRRKRISALQLEATTDNSLKRALNALNLTTLGIGAIIGTGIFVLTGQAAAMHAGPAIPLSFIVAAFGCVFAGLCYAEFASMVPVSGSAYAYSYATLGEFVAWFVGWNLVLEYMLAAATVAVGWSGYFGKLLHQLNIEFMPMALVTAPLAHIPGQGLSLVEGASTNYSGQQTVPFDRAWMFLQTMPRST